MTDTRLASTITVVKKGLLDLGIHGEVTLRADGEAALLDLLRAVAEQRRPRTLVERGPRDDGQANGRGERAVRSVEEITRTLKADLEIRTSTPIDPHSGTFEWLLRHGTDLLNKRQPGTDGLTAWHRLRGRPYGGELLQFGSSVLHRLSGRVVGGVLVDRWHKGTWIGKTTESDEHIIGVDGGHVLRARSVKAMDAPVDELLIQSLKGCTRVNLTTMNMKNIDSGMQNASRPPQGVDGSEGLEDFPEIPLDEDSLRERQRPELDEDALQRARRDQAPPNIDKRQWQITKEVLRQHGLTPHCKGCQAYRMGHTHQSHNDECRKRLEMSMADVPKQVRRFEESRARTAYRRGPGPHDDGATPTTTRPDTTPTMTEPAARTAPDHGEERSPVTSRPDHGPASGPAGSSNDQPTDRLRSGKRPSTTPMEELDPRCTECVDGETTADVDGETTADADVEMSCQEDGVDLLFRDTNAEVKLFTEMVLMQCSARMWTPNPN